MKSIAKPEAGYPSFYQPYLSKVPGDGELLKHLEEIMDETEKLARHLTEPELYFRYSEGKWTIKDIFLHLADCERIIIYRALRIARADKTELPGFDEDLFAREAHAGKREVQDIISELSAFRRASILFIESLDEEALGRSGRANGFDLTVRLLVNHLYGHHRHHLDIIYSKYLRRS